MIQDRVKEIVVTLLPEGAPAVTNEDALVNLGINSLSMVNLLLEIEAAFNITIPPKLVTPANFRSVNSLTQLVEGLKLAA
jgi:acyl carrier protein